MIPQTPTLLIARTSGARVHFLAPDDTPEGHGRFTKSSYYVDDGQSTLGTMYEHNKDILIDLHDACLEASHHFIPKKIFGKSEFREDGDYQLQTAARSSLLNLSTRGLYKALVKKFLAPGSNMRVRKTSDGGLEIGYLVDSFDAMRYANNMAMRMSYSTPDGEEFLENFRKVGLRSENGTSSLKFDLQEVCSPNFFKKEKGVWLRKVAKLKGTFIEMVIKTEMKDPFVTTDPKTYRSVEYTTYKQVPESLRFQFWRHVLTNTTLEFYAHFTLTREEAQYITQSDEPHIYDCAEWSHQFVNGVIESDYAIFVTPLEVARSQMKAANNGAEVHPRTGQLGLMIKPTNLQLVDIPVGSNGGDFENITSVKDFVTQQHTQDGVFQYVPPTGSSEREDVMCVDWTTNIMTVRTGGKTEYQDISSWGAATPWHIRRLIDDTSRYNDVARTPAMSFLRGAFRVAVHYKLTSAAKLVSGNFMPGLEQGDVEFYATQLFSKDSVSSSIRAITTKTILNKNLLPPKDAEELGSSTDSDVVLSRVMKIKFLNDKNPLPILRFFASWMGAVHDRVMKIDIPELCEVLRLQVDSALAFRALLKVWNVYGRKPGSFSNLTTEDAAYRAAYGRQPEDQDELPKDWKMSALPNVSDDLVLMPHQNKAAYSLEKLPKLAFLDVSAGGGKTIMIILDVLRKIKAGVVSTPAVFCPSHLLANYIQDANYSTAGKVNIVPINRSTVDRFGKEYFEKLVKGVAPPNTIYVVDNDLLKWDDQYLSYGAVYEKWYGYAQWIRGLGFDGAWLDESQAIKNESLRSDAMAQAIVDIPYRCLATGTMLTTRIEDVVNQMLVLDPGVFGTQDRFMEEWGNLATVPDWETGQNIPQKAWMAMMMDRNICHVKGRRKEWAALLPPKKTKFYWVHLSDAQRKVYNAVLEATLEEIMADEKLMELIQQQDENMADLLENKLRRYLQRIERFLTAPGADDLSSILKGGDLVSPKGKVIGKIAEDHFKQELPGKILVFTSYIESARAVVESLPPAVRKHTLLYTAAKKMEARERFEKDPNVWMMVGVENSMNTGINAQFCSRLIRVEAIYSPGILEQGESRINRPNLKVKEFRDAIWTDWVLVDKTIDVTKSGRLMWRSLDAAKFYNPESANYQSLPDLSPIRMTLDSIKENNSFEEVIPEYLDGYLKLENEVVAGEIADYKRRHPKLSGVPQPSSGLLKGSALLKVIPYIPGGDVYEQDELGLVPLTEFERMPENVDRSLKGEYCHTAVGDGVIKRFNKDTISVVVGDEEHKFLKTEVFIITKSVTSSKEIRNALAKKVGLPAINPNLKTLDSPEPEPEEDEEEPVIVSPVPNTMENEDENNSGIEVYPSLYNEYFALAIGAADDIDKKLEKDLVSLGFRYTRPTAWVQLKRWTQAETLIAALQDKRRRLVVPKEFFNQLSYAQEALRRGMTHFQQYRKLTRTRASLTLFNQSKARKLPPDEVRPFITLIDGNFFVLIDYQHTPAWSRVRTIQIPGAPWKFDDPCYAFLSEKKSDLIRVGKALSDKHKIANLTWLKEQVNAMSQQTRDKHLSED